MEVDGKSSCGALCGLIKELLDPYICAIYETLAVFSKAGL